MRLSEIGDPRRGVGVIDGVPDILWCDIPGGEVEIGDYPRTTVAPFRMAAYPVTYAQYKAFLEAGDGYGSEDCWQDLEKEDAEPGVQLRPYASYPADNVSWSDATAFCRWLGTRLGFEVQLPDEGQWQWAAQSAQPDFAYPWGPSWREGLANTVETGIGRTTAVGMYSGGRSLQGVYDLAGNVWEWCCNERRFPPRTGPGERVFLNWRGGSWLLDGARARADCQYINPPNDRNKYLGFRVVCLPPIR